MAPIVVPAPIVVRSSSDGGIAGPLQWYERGFFGLFSLVLIFGGVGLIGLGWVIFSDTMESLFSRIIFGVLFALSGVIAIGMGIGPMFMAFTAP